MTILTKNQNPGLLEVENNMEYHEAIDELLPICANCHRIRDGNGSWSQMDSAFLDHCDAELSHGICPSCAQELYPEFYHAED